ncbi:9921_t:CDS:1, partial [Dentiscutata erythropus]
GNKVGNGQDAPLALARMRYAHELAIERINLVQEKPKLGFWSTLWKLDRTVRKICPNSKTTIASNPSHPYKNFGSFATYIPVWEKSSP